MTVEGEGADEVPTDQSNIAVQALDRFVLAVGGNRVKPLQSGYRLTLINRIPLARGLGSSAAARVGALVAANLICDRPLARHQILTLAAQMEGHWDNAAAALFGGIIAVCPSDDTPLVVPLGSPENIWIALCIPSYRLETGIARQVLPKKVPLSDAVYNLSRLAVLTAAVTTRDRSLLKWAMDDRLHQPYRAKLVKGMRDLFEQAQRNGAMGAHLSGAGPTVAAWCPDQATAATVASAMCHSLEQKGVKCVGRWVPLRAKGVVWRWETVSR